MADIPVIELIIVISVGRYPGNRVDNSNIGFQVWGVYPEFSSFNMSLSLRLFATGLSGFTRTMCFNIPLIFDIIISALGVLFDLLATIISLLAIAHIKLIKFS